MYNNNEFDSGFFAGLLAATAGFMFGGAVVFNGFDKDIERKVVKACIEQPKVCKVKYDFYSLKGNK
jgi:hypothetical protein